METAIKSTVAFIGTIVSYLIDGVGLVFTILLCMMALDYITGLLAGWVTRQLSSSVGINGLIRKLYVILLISAVYLLEQVGLDVAGYAGDGIAMAYIVIEFISIVENGGKMGVPILKPLRERIALLKGEKTDA
jgi:toxin secretion/phage lysis holin